MFPVWEPSLRICFSSLCKYIPFVVNEKRWLCCLTSVNAVNDFHLKDPEVLFRNWYLVWHLKAEDCLFQPLQDKKNKHTRMCLQLILIWTSPVFILRVSFVQYCVLSHIFFYVIWCYTSLFTIYISILMMSHLCGLHWSACLNQS